MGFNGFCYNLSHKYGKLGPRGKKCIFIRYSEHSKGYLLIGEQSDGSVTEIESRDVDFIEDQFPSRGEVDRSLELHEIVEQEESAPKNLVGMMKKFFKLLQIIKRI